MLQQIKWYSFISIRTYTFLSILSVFNNILARSRTLIISNILVIILCFLILRNSSSLFSKLHQYADDIFRSYLRTHRNVFDSKVSCINAKTGVVETDHLIMTVATHEINKIFLATETDGAPALLVENESVGFT